MECSFLKAENLEDLKKCILENKKTANGIRWDHQAIYDIIPYGSSVLDLGCGDGELLARLINEKKVQGQGVEKDLLKVEACIVRGVPVYHADLDDEGLDGFPEKFFDYVILERTLQAVQNPMKVLEEMMRVGRQGIISFPNFGHMDIITSFVETKRMPRTNALPYHWYDTPNIHLFTVNDFLDWANENKVKINKGLSWIRGEVQPFREEHDLDAEEVLFVIAKTREG